MADSTKRPNSESGKVVDLRELKILLVDDNDHAMRLVKMILRDLGVNQIFTARDGREALDFLGDCEDMISLVISDWNMPHVTGIELLTQLRTVRPNLPFLMLTARATTDAIKEARDHGVDAYLAKPFSPEQLERKIISLARRVTEKVG
jgi:CheY-like chemotaxis protein